MLVEDRMRGQKLAERPLLSPLGHPFMLFQVLGVRLQLLVAGKTSGPQEWLPRRYHGW